MWILQLNSCTVFKLVHIDFGSKFIIRWWDTCIRSVATTYCIPLVQNFIRTAWQSLLVPPIPLPPAYKLHLQTAFLRNPLQIWFWRVPGHRLLLYIYFCCLLNIKWMHVTSTFVSTSGRSTETSLIKENMQFHASLLLSEQTSFDILGSFLKATSSTAWGILMLACPGFRGVFFQWHISNRDGGECCSGNNWEGGCSEPGHFEDTVLWIWHYHSVMTINLHHKLSMEHNSIQ